MKKVCHLTSVHRWEDTRIFIKECCSLAKHYEVTLIAAGEFEEGKVNGVHILGVPKAQGSRLNRMTGTVKAIYEKALEVNADLYHFHDPELLTVGLLLKRKGKKVIYDVHEDVPRQILNKIWIKPFLRNRISKFFEAFENYSAKRMDYIITSTPFIRDRFLAITPYAKEVCNYPVLEELDTEIPWNQKQEVACYVGGIARTRGIIEMVKALEDTEANLLLAGTFDSETLRQEAMKLSSWKQVKELGFVDRKTIKEVLEGSKLGLVTLHPIPNFVDSLPIKMFEYMAAGIPVVASHFPLWKEIIETHNCGITVDPMKPKEIAEAINRLLHDPELAESMGKRGKKAAQEVYNWGIQEQRLLQIYREVLEG